MSSVAVLSRSDGGRGCERGAALVVAHSVLLRRLLDKAVRFGCGELTAVDDVHVGASGVVLVLATCTLSVPVPDPVRGESRADLRVGGDLKVRLAPLLNIATTLLSVDRNGGCVDLIAPAIVVVLGSHQPAVAVATFAVGGPLKDVGDLIGFAGLECSKDVYSSAALRLACGNSRLGNMAVFQISIRHPGARSS